jgi:deoxyribose-phosphate aldolase
MIVWTPQNLRSRLVVSAALPYDDITEIEDLLQNSSDYHGIAVLPTFVKRVRSLMPRDKGSNLVGLIGYPSGCVTCSTKVTEIRQLVYQGCDSFNVVANTALALSADWEEVDCDLVSVIKSAGGRPVTVTIEAAYLDDEQIKKLVEVSLEAGATAISTTSGWLPKIPESKAIALIKSLVGDTVRVEAAGILNYDHFKLAVDAGADGFFIRRQTAEAILAQMEVKNQ